MRSHVRLPGVRVVTHCKNGGSNILIEYLCYALYSPSQKKGGSKRGRGHLVIMVKGADFVLWFIDTMV